MIRSGGTGMLGRDVAADTWLQAFDAGPDQVIVLYQPADVSVELDPVGIFSRLAEDAAARAASGFRIVSMTAMGLRHAGTYLGQEGSGFETKVAVAVVYERAARSAG
jgi:hypothetical protein